MFYGEKCTILYLILRGKIKGLCGIGRRWKTRVKNVQDSTGIQIIGEPYRAAEYRITLSI